jgi:DNA invertase Pin-like site-specific DNA recombinase
MKVQYNRVSTIEQNESNIIEYRQLNKTNQDKK